MSYLQTVVSLHNLTEEQNKLLLNAEFLKDARLAFDLFDKNGDGQITIAEIQDIFAHQKDHRSNEEVLAMVKEFDKDGDNQLSFEEFAVMLILSQDETKDNIEAFRLFDTNGDGFIDFKEFQDAYIRFGYGITEAEARAKFDSADANKDGQINFAEFQAILNPQ